MTPRRRAGVRALWAACAICAPACLFNPRAYPQYVDTRPAPVRVAPPVDPLSVRLYAPRVTFRELPLAVRGVSLDQPADFRLNLAFDPAEQAPPGAVTLGELRTADRVLDLLGYYALACSFAVALPPRGAAVADPFAPVTPTCRNVDPLTARLASMPVVESLVDEMREHAARVGADAVDEFRCFATRDLLRAWCEGVARRTRTAAPLTPERTAPTAPSAPAGAAPAPSAVTAAASVPVAPAPTPAPQPPALPANADARRAETPGPLSVALRVHVEGPTEGGDDGALTDAGALQRAVVARLHRDPFDDRAETVVDVTFRVVAERWTAQIAFTRAGRTLSLRTLRGRTRDARAVLVATALSLSLALGS